MTTMNCNHCGYLMDDFDDGCPRCHGVGLPARPELPSPPCSKLPARRVWPWKKWGAQILTLVLVAVAGYRTWFHWWIAAQRDAVLVAAVRYDVAPRKHERNPQLFTGTMFVQVAGHDPSPRFLRSFNGDTFTVRKMSEAIQRESQTWKPYTEYFDPQTDLKGKTLFLGEPRWHGPFEVWVADSRSRSAIFLIFRRKSGQWVYENDLDIWIA